MKIKTSNEMWEENIHNYREMIKFFQGIVDGKPIAIKALQFIDPDDHNIPARIEHHVKFDKSPQESIDLILRDIEYTKDEIANFDYWESNPETKKILQRLTKETKTLIKEQIKVIKQEKPENIFIPLERSVDKNFDYFPYFYESIYSFEDNNSEMQKIWEKFRNLGSDNTGIDDYARHAERTSYIDDYETITNEFSIGWGKFEHYIEAFLSLPAEYIWTKYFHPLKNIKKHYGEKVFEIFRNQAEFDMVAPHPFVFINKNPRIIAWVRWYKVNVLKLVGSFKKKTGDYKHFKEVMKGQYKDGEMHGAIETYQAGKLINVTEYNLGVKDGKSIDYREDGTPKYQTKFINGEEGKQEIFFDEAGHPLQGYIEIDTADPGLICGNYVQGKREGEFVRKDDKGKILLKTNYKDGMKNGLEWTSRGHMYKPGEVYSREQNYKDGKLHGLRKSFNKQGKVIRQTNYLNDLKEGDEIEFYPSGTVKCVNKYEKGNLRSWKDYKDGMKQGLERRRKNKK